MTDKWIPVSERLPSGTEWVLAHTVGGQIVFQQFIKHGLGGVQQWRGTDRRFINVEKGYITHWMPKPLPPEDLEE